MSDLITGHLILQQYSLITITSDIRPIISSSVNRIRHFKHGENDIDAMHHQLGFIFTILQVPESEKKTTRSMTLIKKKLSTINSQIKTTDIDSEQNNKGQGGTNEWRPPSPILF